MSFFDAAFDPRADVFGLLDLVEIDTADGPMQFWAGQDGIFTDMNGKKWVGSSLFEVSGLESAIDGVAPSGSIAFSFFQDPTAPDLIGEVKDLGLGYVQGREIRFYVQPVASHEEMHAPKTSPQLWLTRVSRQMSYSANGAQDRSLRLGFETWAEQRRSARRIVLNTEGHKTLTGSENPSLEYMPTVDFEEEKLFG